MSSPAYRLNGQPVSVDAFYAAACNPARSVVVEACAGAGKTWMLVSRILRALLAGAQPQEVLAITFTRKAAGEMRERLDLWLHTFSASRCDDAKREAELRQRGMTAQEARVLAPRLGLLHSELLKAGRPPQIHTFHRWFFQLLRAAPLELLSELNLSADMQLVEDWADHEPELFRRFHQAVMMKPGLLADFEILVQDHGRSQLRKWLDTALQKRIELTLADQAQRLESSVPSAGEQWPVFAALVHPAQRLNAVVVQEALRELAAELARQKGALARKAADGLQEAFRLADAAEQFSAIRAALFTTTGTVRKAADVPSLSLALAYLDDIHAATEQQAAHERHLRMTRLSRCLLQTLADYKAQRALADMADVELCALRLLRDASLSGWVQERLDTQIRHLLIDEFQDTSPLQWHALHAWLSSYAGAGGGASGQQPPSVFIVGDPKQSIYRFRRAEPKVFEAAQQFVQQALGGVMLACDHTHRNAPGVLDAVNAVFGEAEAQGQYSGFRAHTTQVKHELTERDPCRVWRLAMDTSDDNGITLTSSSEWRDTLTTPRLEPEQAKRQFEASSVAQAIHQLVRAHGVAPKDIKVLSRKRSVLRLLQQSLQSLGLPFAAVGDYALAQEPVVRDLLALLDVLVSPQHRLSLAQALRSPVFSVSDDDLVALATEAQSQAEEAQGASGDWWDALQRVALNRVGLQRAAKLLPAWQQAAQQLPPHDLLDRIVFEGQVHERVATRTPGPLRTQALAAVDALLAQTLVLDGARYATPYNFVRALRRRVIEVASPPPANATELLTIHGAKGLEAPWVFLMDTDPIAQKPDTVTLLIDWPVEEAAPLTCAFVYATSRCPPSLKHLLAQENVAREREELNGLYVAMTRAEHHLVLSATAGASSKTLTSAGAAPAPSWWQRVAPHARSWRCEALFARPEGEGAVAEHGGLLPVGNAGHSPPARNASEQIECWILPTLPERAPQNQNVAAPTLTKAVSCIPQMDRPCPTDDAATSSSSSQLGEAVHLALQWACNAIDAYVLDPTPSGSVSPAATTIEPVREPLREPLLEPLAQAAAQEHAVNPAEVLHIVQTIWSSPACAGFLRGPGLRWAGNEVPITVAGQSLRIDRLVALPDANDVQKTVWWVLDYKLHPAPHTVPEYLAQLQNYGRAVQRAQAVGDVKCAFITGTGAVVEVAAGPASSHQGIGG